MEANERLRALAVHTNDVFTKVIQAHPLPQGNPEPSEAARNTLWEGATTISSESRGQVFSKRPASLFYMKVRMKRGLGPFQTGGEYYFLREGGMMLYWYSDNLLHHVYEEAATVILSLDEDYVDNFYAVKDPAMVEILWGEDEAGTARIFRNIQALRKEQR